MHLGMLHNGRKPGALLRSKLVLRFCCTVPLQHEQVCFQLTVGVRGRRAVGDCCGSAKPLPNATSPPAEQALPRAWFASRAGREQQPARSSAVVLLRGRGLTRLSA